MRIANAAIHLINILFTLRVLFNEGRIARLQSFHLLFQSITGVPKLFQMRPGRRQLRLKNRRRISYKILFDTRDLGLLVDNLQLLCGVKAPLRIVVAHVGPEAIRKRLWPAAVALIELDALGLCSHHGLLGLHVDLHRGQKGLFALEQDLTAVLTKLRAAEGECEVRGHKLGRPAALTGHTMGVLVGLEKIAFQTFAAVARRTVLADNRLHATLVVFEANLAGHD